MSLETTEISKPAPEEVYQAILRALRRRKGFGIVFVQCSPAQATRLIARIEQDLSQKKIAILNLTESIDNLYEIIDQRSDKNELNILFIQGIEKSLEAYIKPGYGGEGDYYNLDTVPRILSHLNQQRENFRDHFPNICFVFVLPLFGIKYFIRRAPDFFDWSSGVFEFPTEAEQLDKESRQFLLKGSDKLYSELTYQECNQKLLKIEELIQEQNQTSEIKADLLLEQGNLFILIDEFEAAISCYEKALKLQPDNHVSWRNRGYALYKLGRLQEAVLSYNKAISINPNFKTAWYGRGDALVELGQDQEAIASYEKVILDSEFQLLLKSNTSINMPIISFIKRSLTQFNLRNLEVNDILHEVYLQGYSLIKSGRSIENIPAWIRRTAYSIIINKHRQELKYNNIAPTFELLMNQEMDVQNQKISEEEDLNYNLMLVQKALKTLEPIEQNIIKLYYIKGVSQSKIAMQLQLTQPTLSRKIYNAIERLRRIIK